MELDDFITALNQANESAGRAALTLVQGLGLNLLLAEIMAERDDARHVPGMTEWIETLKRSSALACEAADRVLDEGDGGGEAEVAQMVLTASDSAIECETALRSIAQLAMGTTTAYGGASDVARLERTSSVIIAIDAGLGHGIFADGYLSAASNIDELEIELAGFLCRMNLEHGARLEITAPQGTIVVRTDEVGDLSSSVQLVAGSEIVLQELGWSEGGTTSWPSPPVIALPSRQVAATLVAMNGGSGDHVQFFVTFNDGVEVHE